MTGGDDEPMSTVRIAIHQPGYHRHLYYFYKMLVSDAFVSMDNVQYVPREFQNRQQFYVGGSRAWLSVPVNRGREPLVNKKIVDHIALSNHWTRIRSIYGRTPYFPRYADELAGIYETKWDRLVDLCDALTELARQILGIRTPYLRASEAVPIPVEARKGELLALLCGWAADAMGARSSTVVYQACPTPMRSTHYLCQLRPDGWLTEREYMVSLGVEVATFAYVHPVYRQGQLPKGAGFQPELSVFDLIFNYGDDAREILAGSGQCG